MILLAIQYISGDGIVTKASLMPERSCLFLLCFPKHQSLPAFTRTQDQQYCTVWQDEIAHHYKNIGKGYLITYLEDGLALGSDSLSRKSASVADLPADSDLGTSVKSLLFVLSPFAPFP